MGESWWVAAQGRCIPSGAICVMRLFPSPSNMAPTYSEHTWNTTATCYAAAAAPVLIEWESGYGI